MKDRPEQEGKIADAWTRLQYAKQSSKTYNELFWSHNAFADVIRNKPRIAWRLVLRILKSDASPKILENLSAGPLEDLLVRHGATLIAEVEAESLRNPQFRKLLGGVWKQSMNDDVWSRVVLCRDRRGWDGSPA